MFGKLRKGRKGAINVVAVLIDIILITALIPIMKTFISDAEGNRTATEYVLLGLVALFLILGVVYATIKGTGLVKAGRM